MYLSTTVARSTVWRSTPSSRAITSAASVLPVPLGPENIAVRPSPRPPRAAARQASSTSARCRTRAVSSRRAADTLRRHHEVGPAGDGLDPPGEALQAGGVLQPGAGVDVGDLERTAPVACREARRGGGPLDALRSEPERRRDRRRDRRTRRRGPAASRRRARSRRAAVRRAPAGRAWPTPGASDRARRATTGNGARRRVGRAVGALESTSTFTWSMTSPPPVSIVSRRRPRPSAAGIAPLGELDDDGNTAWRGRPPTRPAQPRSARGDPRRGRTRSPTPIDAARLADPRRRLHHRFGRDRQFVRMRATPDGSCSSPSNAVTMRSGTRNGRVRNGRRLFDDIDQAAAAKG